MSGAVWIVIGLGVVAVGTAVAHAVRPSWRLTGVAVTLAALVFMSGLLGTALGIRHTYFTIGQMAPTERQRALAEGMARAMDCTAVALGALLLWVPPFVIGEIRRRRDRQQRAALRLED